MEAGSSGVLNVWLAPIHPAQGECDGPTSSMLPWYCAQRQQHALKGLHLQIASRYHVHAHRDGLRGGIFNRPHGTRLNTREEILQQPCLLFPFEKSLWLYSVWHNTYISSR